MKLVLLWIIHKKNLFKKRLRSTEDGLAMPLRRRIRP